MKKDLRHIILKTKIKEMKKLFLLFTILFAALALQSCNDDTPRIDYDVMITGYADGDINIMFPGGTFDLRGYAGLDFHYGADTLMFCTPVYTIDDIIDNPQVAKAYKAVLNDFDDKFAATSMVGKYYFHVFGYATAYGLKIQIDKVLSNDNDE